MTAMRSRWAAIGAAAAVTLGAGGISLGQAAISSGDKPVFVGIEPCRLVDTRPGDDNIGGRTTPLGAGDTLTLQVTGSTGQCSGIPADAVAAAMNVTAIQPTAQSFLSVYPADADLPLASNLNWNGGDPPTPNKVDVKLSPTGAVNITNAFGTVHVAADLVGYYTDHTHDDRYYTKSQVNSALTQQKLIHITTMKDVDDTFQANPPIGGPLLLDSSLVLPPDYTPGTALTLVVNIFRLDLSAQPCSATMSTDYLYALRPSTGGAVMSDMTDTAFVSFGAISQQIRPAEFTITGDFEPGDSLSFGVGDTALTCSTDKIGTHTAVLYYD